MESLEKIKQSIVDYSRSSGKKGKKKENIDKLVRSGLKDAWKEFVLDLSQKHSLISEENAHEPTRYNTEGGFLSRCKLQGCFIRRKMRALEVDDPYLSSAVQSMDDMVDKINEVFALRKKAYDSVLVPEEILQNPVPEPPCVQSRLDKIESSLRNSKIYPYDYLNTLLSEELWRLKQKIDKEKGAWNISKSSIQHLSQKSLFEPKEIKKILGRKKREKLGFSIDDADFEKVSGIAYERANKMITGLSKRIVNVASKIEKDRGHYGDIEVNQVKVSGRAFRVTCELKMDDGSSKFSLKSKDIGTPPKVEIHEVRELEEELSVCY